MVTTPSPTPVSVPERFVADAMLGRLARWLRILGYDTVYHKVISDEALIDCALKEHRWLLTRDGYMAKRKVLRGRHTLVRSDHLTEQLAQLRDELGLHFIPDANHAYRCAECNETLSVIPREDAIPRVPPLVAVQHHRFMECRRCGRLYWPGTHWTGIRQRLARLLRSSSATQS